MFFFVYLFVFVCNVCLLNGIDILNELLVFLQGQDIRGPLQNHEDDQRFASLQDNADQDYGAPQQLEKASASVQGSTAQIRRIAPTRPVSGTPIRTRQQPTPNPVGGDDAVTGQCTPSHAISDTGARHQWCCLCNGHAIAPCLTGVLAPARIVSVDLF